jgi:MFS transporter, MHS family, shikimate and dehydroshikimate transport protein
MESAAREEQSTQLRNVATASLVGTMIEWYDYFIFGTAAALVFGQLFFPNSTPLAGTLASFATFSVGFFVRPVGSIIFGHFGDRIGRKNMLILTLIMMGAATFIIGLLPTAATIGVWAPILLVAMRILQGLGVSGEWGGAVLLAAEYAPERQRGFYGSFPQVGNSIGLLLATGSFALLSLLPEEQFLAWGWRVPFLASIVLVGVGLWIRLRIMETPIFRDMQQSQSESEAGFPIVEVIRDHYKSVLAAIGVRISNDTQGYIVIVFSVSYVTETLGMASGVSTSAIAIAAFFAIFVGFISGRLSDRVGRRPILAVLTVLIMAFAFPFFWLIGTKTLALIYLAYVVMYSIGNIGTYAIQASLLPELFPTRVRYTGTAFSYNMTSVVAGGIAPFIATALVAWAGGAFWPVVRYLWAVCLITLITLVFLSETSRESLTDVQPIERTGAVGGARTGQGS